MALFNYVVTYNDVTLNVSKITNWEMSYVYNDDETQILYTHYNISVRGVVSSQINGGAPDLFKLNNIRQDLSIPRRDFSIQSGGVFALQILASDEFPDAKNGPIPRGVKVIEIQGGTFLVEMTIEANVSECEDGRSSGTPKEWIISNRWSQTQDIDKNGMSTLTSIGTIIVDTSNGNTAEDFRGVPFPIRNRYKFYHRDRQKFTLSMDGTRLDWEIEDKEYYRPGVDYVTNWDATWSESSNWEEGMGAIQVGTLSVKAYASNEAADGTEPTIAYLLSFCLYVYLARLPNNGVIYIKSYNMEEGLTEKYVALNVQLVIATQKDVKAGNTKTPLKITTQFGQNLGEIDTKLDQGDINENDDVGTYEFKLLVQKLFGPCDNQSDNSSPQEYEPQTPILYGRSPEYKYDPNPTYDNKLNIQQTNYPYIKSSIQLQTSSNAMIAQSPRTTNYSSSNSASAFISLGSKLTKKTVTFNMVRLGQTPDVPYAQPTNNNYFLLNSDVVTLEPEFLPDGVTQIYSVYGTYVYGLLNPIAIDESPIKMPRSPYDDNNQQVFNSYNNDIITIA